jgi:amidohydrolase
MPAKSLREDAYRLEERLIELRRDLHMNPELSFQEFKTGDKIESILKECGIAVTREVGKTGIVGILEGRGAAAGSNDGSKKVVALRADMDALPIEEQNSHEYVSRTKGIMHACGHDVHTTSLLGAALILSRYKNELPGIVKFIFQAAEEKNAGAKAMMKDRVLKNPEVDAIFGLHTSPNIEAGKVGVKEGPLMAAVDTIGITIRGEGGHGAVPEKARDAIVAAATVVQSLQTVVSRKISPFDSAVVSIGTIEGGRANNVIADFVKMTGTCRSFNPKVRERLPKLLERIIWDTCSALDTEGELDYLFDLPAVINDPYCTQIGRTAVETIGGEGAAVTPAISGGGEDFAIFMEKVPGCFFHLGVRNEERGIVYEWHHPRFDADERALPVGAGILAQSAWDYLSAV